MIAAESLAAVGAMIARYRSGGRFSTDYEIARITVALRDLRVRDDAWARMDPGTPTAPAAVDRRGPPGPARLRGRARLPCWPSWPGSPATARWPTSLWTGPWPTIPVYSMALLLRQVITAGAPPSLARLPMTPEEVAASYDEAEAGARLGEDDDSDDDDYVRGLDAADHDPDSAGED